MNEIKIKVPTGKVAVQEEKGNCITITFKDADITERIKTYEDAVRYCQETDEYRSLLMANPILPIDTEDLATYKKLKVICFALNEGSLPDYLNTNVKKWFPIFSLSSGFGFSHSLHRYSNAAAHVGFRLCFKSEKLANYAGKQFQDLYQSYLTK